MGEGDSKKVARYLMDLPTCEAQSKQTGLRCKNYASKGKKVCRFHGGRSTGARTKQGRIKQKMASYVHGMRSTEAIAERKATREFMKACTAAIRG